MGIKTDHLNRCVLTLESSLLLYQHAKPESVEQEVFRNAIVKGYELSQETSFKLLKRALREYGHIAKILEGTPVKEVLRLASTHDIFTLDELERWFAYRNNRNNTAHEYGEVFASETLKLLPSFIVDIRKLSAKLEAIFNKESDVDHGLH